MASQCDHHSDFGQLSLFGAAIIVLLVFVLTEFI